MHLCTCGRAFPGTLDGAWEAKLHADGEGHLVGLVRDGGLLARPRAATA